MESGFEKNGILFKILHILPHRVARILEDELSALGVFGEDLFEIRLRRGARCSLLTKSGIKGLAIRLTDADADAILTALTGGALYAHRDTLLDGYLTPFSGLRVGVCARVRYDGGTAVGISEVRSFIFRISHGKCDFENELYGIWRSRGERSMLIYSPPCGGKTTAIRRLAARIGKDGRRVCVVDERCEFLPEEYTDSEVDILRGYKKSKGIEIAVRTLGAELVVVDEIGAEEARSVLSSLTLGVPFIATVHARCADEVLERPAFSPFIAAGVFETLVGIRKSTAGWRLEAASAPSSASGTKSAKAGYLI